MSFRDRIKELRRVRAGDLYANPQNWREHPDRQRTAMRTMLERIGYAGALVAREVPDGLEILDGHLRAGLDPDQLVPVLVTDLDDKEASEYLLSADPLSAMAEADQQALKVLLEQVTLADDGSLANVLNQIRLDYVDLSISINAETNDAGEAWQGMPRYENTDLEAHRSIIVHFKTAADVEAFAKLLGVPVSERARFIWYPAVERERAADKMFVAGAKDGAA